LAPSDPSSGRPAPPSFAPADAGLLVVLALAWGSAYVFIRQGIVLGASPLVFAAVRYGLSAAVFAALAAIRREARPTRSSLLLSAGIGGVFVIGLYGGFLYWGEQYTTGGYASVLSSTAPILTVVLAWFLLPAERLRALSVVGIAIGFVGTVVLVLPEIGAGPGIGWRGPAFVLAAFLSTAFGTVLLRRVGVGRQGLWHLGSQFLLGGVVLAVAAAILPYPRALPSSPGVWTSLLALVGFSSVVGYFVYYTLHHRVGPVRANVVAYLLPLVGIGIGSGFFGEPVTVTEIVGFLIVVGGVTLVLRGSMVRRTPGVVPKEERPR